MNYKSKLSYVKCSVLTLCAKFLYCTLMGVEYSCYKTRKVIELWRLPNLNLPLLLPNLYWHYCYYCQN